MRFLDLSAKLTENIIFRNYRNRVCCSFDRLTKCLCCVL